MTRDGVRALAPPSAFGDVLSEGRRGRRLSLTIRRLIAIVPSLINGSRRTEGAPQWRVGAVCIPPANYHDFRQVVRGDISH